MRVLFFIIIFIPTILFSHEFDCDPTCANSTDTTQTLTVAFGNTCYITITINKKECPDGSVIIKVVSIDSFDYGICGNPGPGIIMIQVISALIEDNPLGLGSGSHKYVYPSCWKFNSEDFSSVTPCNPIICCTVEIVYDSHCNRVLPTRMSWEGTKYCPPQPIGGCQNACIDTDHEFEINYRDLNGSN